MADNLIICPLFAPCLAHPSVDVHRGHSISHDKGYIFVPTTTTDTQATANRKPSAPSHLPTPPNFSSLFLLYPSLHSFLPPLLLPPPLFYHQKSSTDSNHLHRRPHFDLDLPSATYIPPFNTRHLHSLSNATATLLAPARTRPIAILATASTYTTTPHR